MTHLSDLAPTDRLPGVHMQGIVTRRFLITYPVRPEALASAVPPGAELMLHKGLAWVSACFVHIAGMRPATSTTSVPEEWGLDFNYLIHRTLARLPYPDGKHRPSVLVLEANINRPLLGLVARTLTGVRFQNRDISLTELSDSWVVKVNGWSDALGALDVLYEAEIDKASIGPDIASSSQFASASEADRFLLGISFGGQWEPEAHQVRLLAETHEPWQTFVGGCITKRHAFLESLGVQGAAADHVITMTDIPHYFALRGIVVPCP